MIEYPPILYGTAWKEDSTQECVEAALAAGFRGIDTANQRKHYFEEGVGNAIRNFNRADLFLQTKFTFLRGQDHRLPYNPEAELAVQVRQSFESSLKHLNTDYLDSYVLHGPSGGYGLTDDDWEVWGAMEEIHASGKAKLLGVSNVSLSQLRLLYADADTKPAFVQNRCYARTGWDKEIRVFCTAKGIRYQGFSLLTANQEIFQHPKFNEILQRVGCTPAQAIFSFARKIGMLPLTGTTDPAHMKEDLEGLEVDLSSEDLATIEKLS